MVVLIDEAIYKHNKHRRQCWRCTDHTADNARCSRMASRAEERQVPAWAGSPVLLDSCDRLVLLADPLDADMAHVPHW